MPFLSFADIIDQEEAIGQLQHALQRQTLAHGYLFHGPAGVGKATTALALAQRLFCRQPMASGGYSLACGRCPSCGRMAADSHPDLFRLEMQEERTRILVDQVRELNGFLALTPMEAPWKVALIDDAAMMNEAAANALLKTLEEPPADSLLILITHRVGSLLPTIRSRCQQVRFSPLSEAGLLRLFQGEASADSLAEASALAGGSARKMKELLTGNVLSLRREFFQELTTLDLKKPGSLIAMATKWAKGEGLAVVAPFLQEWFREEIHAMLASRQQEREKGQHILTTAHWSEQLLVQAKIFNLNAQMVLEAILIRIAQLQVQLSAGKLTTHDGNIGDGIG